MKTLLIFSCLVCSFFIFKPKSTGTFAVITPRYVSPLGYVMDYPEKYSLDDSVPELITFMKDDKTFRINAGCYDFGVESFTKIVDQVFLAGRPALKEDYFAENILKMRKYIFNDDNNKCYSIEMTAETESGFDELLQVAKTLRFNH